MRESKRLKKPKGYRRHCFTFRAISWKSRM